jgi:acetyl esterase/lipase
MMNFIKSSVFLILFSLLGISSIAQIDAEFTPIPASFDINSTNPLYALNINYDDIDLEKQRLHIFLPDTIGNYPLVVFIHGGGFTGGSPDGVISDPAKRADIKYFLERGFAYASFGYRLIETTQADPDGVIKSLNDSKRALQFVRHYSDELYINPEKIALVGSSAGAGTSLWLGTRDDMADPDANDPVLKESTRVCAVVLNGSQATYDLYKWESQVYNNFDGNGTNYTLDSLENLLGYDRFSNFYGGVDSLEQMFTDPALIQYREDVDMLFHMSADDAPIYVRSTSMAIHPNQNIFHHAFHGREIYNTALAANVSEVKADIPYLSVNTTEGESRNEFLERHLNECALSTSTIENIADSKELNIYPNPANTYIQVDLPEGQINEIEIFSMTGQLMQRLNNDIFNTIEIPVSNLPLGTYIIRVGTENGLKINKMFIVQ